MPADLSPDHPHAPRAAVAQREEKLAPAVRRLRVALRAADYLAVAILVHADRDEHRNALVGPSPILLEVGAVDAGVGVGAGQRPGPPLLDLREGLLVEVGDGALGHGRAPEDLARVLDPARGDAGQARLHHGLLHRALAPTVALDDLGREGRAPELGDAQLELPGTRDQPAPVVAAAVGLALVGSLVAPGVHELVGLLVEQRVDGLLDGGEHQLPDVALYGLLVE